MLKRIEGYRRTEKERIEGYRRTEKERIEGYRRTEKERIERYKRTEKELEDHSLAEWAFDSHNWNEIASGYFTCLWCGIHHTSTQGISREFPLCKKNPILKKILK